MLIIFQGNLYLYCMFFIYLYRYEYIMKDTTILKELYVRRSNLLTQLKAVNSAIVGFGGSEKVTENDYKLEPIYAMEWTWKRKILYVLKGGERFTVKDIVNILLQIEPGLDKKRTLRAVTLYASRLHIAGVLEADKSSRAFKYGIKQKNQ